MTKDELYKNWQNFYSSGKGTFKKWYDTIGKPNGLTMLPGVILSFAAREAKETGASNAELTIKYGTTIMPDIGGPGKMILSGIASGFAAGGPIGAVVGAFGGAIAHDAKENAVAKSVINEANQIRANTATIEQQQKLNQNLTKNENDLASVASLLQLNGPQLWVLFGLILAGLYLMFVKK